MRMCAIAVAVAVLGCGSKKDDAPVEVKPTNLRPASDELSEAEYAELLMVGLKAKGVTKPGLHFDAAKGQITDGEMNLATTNLYAEYLKLSNDERVAQIDRTVATFSAAAKGDKLTFEAAKPKLLPAVRAGLYFDFDLQLAGRVDAKKVKTPAVPVFLPMGELTGVGVAIDEPQSMAIATDKDLTDWKVSVSDALAIATANLAAQNVELVELSPGVWTSPAHDNYDASRLVLVDRIAKLKLKGAPVALIPNRDTLLIAGDQDATALLAMAELAEKASEEPRPIHTVPLCLKARVWAECEPAPTPEVKLRMHQLALAGRSSVYAEQHDKLQTAVGEDVFVAKLSVLQDKKTKKQVSYATWTKTVPTLLPRADFIAFMIVPDDDKPESAQMLGLVPWERVQQVLGARLQRDTRSPPRWATGTMFPSDAELVKLAPTKDLF